MAFASKYQRIAAALLAIVSASVLVWFGNGLTPWWPLLWFAPLPVLIFALRNSWWSAGLVAALSWQVGGLDMWQYFRALGIPPSAWIGLFSVVALVFAGAVLLFRALVRHGALWSAMLAFPATWVCYEYLRNFTTPHGTAGSVAYSQLNFLPFLQLASITGPWGMSFLLMLFPAALAIGIHLRKTAPKRALRVVGTALGMLALVLIFGAVRLSVRQSHEVVKVGLVASDAPGNVGIAEGAKTERLFRDYAAEAKKLSRRGAQIVVLPEKLGLIADPDTKSADAIFQPLADETRSLIVVGVVHVSPPVKYNEARVYAPGAPVLSYHKQHMLPPFESNLKPGTTLTLLRNSRKTVAVSSTPRKELRSSFAVSRRASTPFALLRKPLEIRGIAICKDMDFTRLSRQYGEAGVGLMLAPAWDFNMDRWWHGHIAVMRGVEDGFSIARAAKNGYLTVSDDRGRILAETRSDSAPFATLLADVPAVHDTTLYLLLGDWFPWFAVATLVFALAQLYRMRRYPVPEGRVVMHDSALRTPDTLFKKLKAH